MVLAVHVYSNVAEYLGHNVEFCEDFTTRIKLSIILKTVVLYEIGAMLAKMRLVHKHDLTIHMLLYWRDLCRDFVSNGFALELLTNHAGKLSIFMFTCDYKIMESFSLVARIQEWRDRIQQAAE